MLRPCIGAMRTTCDLLRRWKFKYVAHGAYCHAIRLPASWSLANTSWPTGSSTPLNPHTAVFAAERVITKIAIRMNVSYDRETPGRTHMGYTSAPPLLSDTTPLAARRLRVSMTRCGDALNTVFSVWIEGLSSSVESPHHCTSNHWPQCLHLDMNDTTMKT